MFHTKVCKPNDAKIESNFMILLIEFYKIGPFILETIYSWLYLRYNLQYVIMKIVITNMIVRASKSGNVGFTKTWHKLWRHAQDK